MLKSWRVRRAVLFVCGLGCALMAIGALTAPERAAQPGVAPAAVQASLRTAVVDLRAGRAPADALELAAAIEAADAAIAAAQETRTGMGLGFGFVAAMNLLLWAVTPARADEAQEEGVR